MNFSIGLVQLFSAMEDETVHDIYSKDSKEDRLDYFLSHLILYEDDRCLFAPCSRFVFGCTIKWFQSQREKLEAIKSEKCKIRLGSDKGDKYIQDLQAKLSECVCSSHQEYIPWLFDKYPLNTPDRRGKWINHFRTKGKAMEEEELALLMADVPYDDDVNDGVNEEDPERIAINPDQNQDDEEDKSQTHNPPPTETEHKAPDHPMGNTDSPDNGSKSLASVASSMGDGPKFTPAQAPFTPKTKPGREDYFGHHAGGTSSLGEAADTPDSARSDSLFSEPGSAGTPDTPRSDQSLPRKQTKQSLAQTRCASPTPKPNTRARTRQQQRQQQQEYLDGEKEKTEVEHGTADSVPPFGVKTVNKCLHTGTSDNEVEQRIVWYNENLVTPKSCNSYIDYLIKDPGPQDQKRGKIYIAFDGSIDSDVKGLVKVGVTTKDPVTRYEPEKCQRMKRSTVRYVVVNYDATAYDGAYRVERGIQLEFYRQRLKIVNCMDCPPNQNNQSYRSHIEWYRLSYNDVVSAILRWQYLIQQMWTSKEATAASVQAVESILHPPAIMATLVTKMGWNKIPEPPPGFVQMLQDKAFTFQEGVELRRQGAADFILGADGTVPSFVQYTESKSESESESVLVQLDHAADELQSTIQAELIEELDESVPNAQSEVMSTQQNPNTGHRPQAAAQLSSESHTAFDEINDDQRLQVGPKPEQVGKQQEEIPDPLTHVKVVCTCVLLFLIPGWYPCFCN